MMIDRLMIDWEQGGCWNFQKVSSGNSYSTFKSHFSAPSYCGNDHNLKKCFFFSCAVLFIWCRHHFVPVLHLLLCMAIMKPFCLHWQHGCIHHPSPHAFPSLSHCLIPRWVMSLEKKNTAVPRPSPHNYPCFYHGDADKLITENQSHVCQDPCKVRYVNRASPVRVTQTQTHTQPSVLAKLELTEHGTCQRTRLCKQ